MILMEVDKVADEVTNMDVDKVTNMMAKITNEDFLASWDAIEPTWVSQSVSELLTLRTELTDVTLVSEDTYWGLYCQDSCN